MAETDYSVRSFKGGYDDNLTYLVTCIHTGNQFLVDASVPLKQILPFVKKNGLIVLFITHTHGDHTAYLDDYVEAFPNLVVMIYKDSEDIVKSTLKRPVKHGDIVTVGQLSLEVFHTPGHYPDSVCYLLDDILFTGDTLFVGRTGRTVSSGSDTRQLYHSVYNIILDLPGNIIIYPGHDYGPKMTISIDENISLSPLLQAEDVDDFIHQMAKYENERTFEN
ncbi:MAG: MBL fold metallo-hydrolase [Candidatus Marinimicrobia bacterium]|jgi:glyoxylase-like metal-dependent hydrolase (beta-lactamase superfamily II)|nr:MBL fold metallo-hydrolase [Candidatus Neomarinimicrobiota bacterium]MBT3663748.1 MBL fold metallo-hydrolase [Candidatus Neomarinimicrobiota bacterium]MBT3947007.1 MBL fold metallo-hydrolase [Candidatus Neomarinimicrobiota bacterium]MBT4065491.1 MBL fold metallo-hydrolase [Candidatus Neomarinimicrobiota bacterium]MBT4307397.1 MBL fold metallo-hydrolase [Candidatus Neomarinimicrobiota bacterium]|tara:strand:+ start:1442 stop:2104 length:663 start_codon:yes stop_codon:yes gene_type:complete